ncbi:hypothetical protein GSH19_03630 [Lactobacillus sp. S2-2]|uniref:hypothetical protein n=1 Tax=Lactobacillus sp. S2-2 TaxID=2692917 RepID=UPI001F2B558E|nr:hypothetical protein [Lactobacillus sp. S2-2]MCF6515243.1 hypothetical protein [Lactobacillus sp. S2-2]
MTNISKTELINVIKAGNDQFNNRLVVNRDGKIYLYEVETNHQVDPVLIDKNLAVINSEHFMPNQEYVGHDAASDQKFIDIEFSRLSKAWKKYLISKTLQYTSDHNY